MRARPPTSSPRIPTVRWARSSAQARASSASKTVIPALRISRKCASSPRSSTTFPIDATHCRHQLPINLSTPSPMHQKILILDFGSQYTQLIARRVREANVYCELHSWDVADDFIREFNPAGSILAGGPNSVYEEETPRVPQSVFELGVPVLGICYGMQAMAAQLGGKVESSNVREFGYAEVRAHGHSALFMQIQDRTNPQNHGLLDVWMSHGDKVTELPDGFKIIASNESTPIVAIADETRRFYALQFHPEVTHTKQGKAIIESFVRSEEH